MSYYYNYYIGYISNNKIYPFGPYNATNSLVPAVSRSSSFASNLKDDFYMIPKDMFSDELRKEFPEDSFSYLKYLYLSELPKDSFIRKGYFLIQDVTRYEQDDDKDTWDLFYDRKTPDVYCQMLQNQLIFGKPQKEVDEDGTEYTPKCAYDYMYYCYPEYHSKEYESFLLKEVADMLYQYTGIPEGSKFVIILAEG